MLRAFWFIDSSIFMSSQVWWFSGMIVPFSSVLLIYFNLFLLQRKKVIVCFGGEFSGFPNFFFCIFVWYIWVCGYVCGVVGEQATDQCWLGIFLSHPPPYSLRIWSSLIRYADWLALSSMDLPISTSLALNCFYLSAGDLNSDPHAYMASTLLAEHLPSPPLHFYLI